MPQAGWSTQPGVSIQVVAQTAKTTWVKLVTAGDAGASDVTIAFDNTEVTQGLPRMQGPMTFAPVAVKVPDIPSGTAGYFQTAPVIQGPQELVAKTTEALRKAYAAGVVGSPTSPSVAYNAWRANEPQ